MVITNHIEYNFNSIINHVPQEVFHRFETGKVMYLVTPEQQSLSRTACITSFEYAVQVALARLHQLNVLVFAVSASAIVANLANVSVPMCALIECVYRASTRFRTCLG